MAQESSVIGVRQGIEGSPLGERKKEKKHVRYVRGLSVYKDSRALYYATARRVLLGQGSVIQIGDAV
jgi:hypothetical protein